MDVKPISVKDVAPEKIFSRFFTISVSRQADFNDLVFNDKMNMMTGSFFSDGRKRYFFGGSLCIMHQNEGR